MLLSRAVNIAVTRARALGKPTVVTMLTPHAVSTKQLAGLGETPPPATNAWDNSNKAISVLASTIGAGTKFYADQQSAKLAQANADAMTSQLSSAQQADRLAAQIASEQARIAAAQNKLPSWVIPAVIGTVALAGVGAFFYFRKKA
jgi:uncharacterized protein HemX